LAGNGSAITLTIFMEFMGLSPIVANATNRIGAGAQSIVSTTVFHKAGKIDWKWGGPYIVITFLGGMFGLWLALIVNDAQFKAVYGYLMIVMLVVVLVNPKRWIQPSDKPPMVSKWVLYILFFLLGIYGGFIQMGMGVIFLAVTVLLGRMDIIRANALKVVCVGAYTMVLLVIFHIQGLLDWKAGSLVAIGQVLGAWVCSKFAATNPKAGVVAHRVLVAVVIFAIVKVFVVPMFQ